MVSDNWLILAGPHFAGLRGGWNARELLVHLASRSCSMTIFPPFSTSTTRLAWVALQLVK